MIPFQLEMIVLRCTCIRYHQKANTLEFTILTTFEHAKPHLLKLPYFVILFALKTSCAASNVVQLENFGKCKLG